VADGAHYEQLVKDFCGAWADADFDRVVSYFAEDGVYHNIPVDPLTGHEAIRGMIEMFTAGLKIVEFKILTMLSDGPTVITERVDIFEREDGGLVELPVMGIFEFDGDLIKSWREYFDLNQFMTQAMPPA
jgi:limonene-1,2-epoxide hydrolase